MARGWESKSVEAQIDSAQDRIRVVCDPSFSPAILNQMRKKEGLISSRARVFNELEAATNPRYQAVLRKALTELDAQLSALV